MFVMKLHGWTRARLQDQRPGDSDLYLRESIMALQADTMVMSRDQLDKVLFQFSLRTGLIRAKERRDLWIEAVECASNILNKTFSRLPLDDPEQFPGVYMFWECLISDGRNIGRRGISEVTQRATQLIRLQLTIDGEIVQMAAVHGLNHLEVDERDSLLAEVVAAHGDDRVGSLAKASIRRELM